jgi:hypothetical protein
MTSGRYRGSGYNEHRIDLHRYGHRILNAVQ